MAARAGLDQNLVLEVLEMKEEDFATLPVVSRKNADQMLRIYYNFIVQHYSHSAVSVGPTAVLKKPCKLILKSMSLFVL